MTERTTAGPETVVSRTPGRKLALKRETVQDLDMQLLSSQGHSLWTCDGSVYDDRPQPGDPGDRS